MKKLNRRVFLNHASRGTALAATSSLGLAGILASRQAPAAGSSEIHIPYGAQAGDVLNDRAIIWSRADRDAKMIVEWSNNEDFSQIIGRQSVTVVKDTDFTGKLDIHSLPAGEQVFYRVSFEDLAAKRSISQPTMGSLSVPPSQAQNVRFVWSGDTAGQGWGINENWGGMRIYDTMLNTAPDFFIHSGDTIYADGPLQEEVKLEDGSIWTNIVTEAKSKVAETLQEFRGNYAYNLMDKNVRAFNAKVPMFAQWDDHEIVNNWYPGEILEDDRYQIDSVDLLAARGHRAFMDYMPIRPHATERNRLYGAFSWGPQLDIFRLDMRSYRGPNSTNRQESKSEDTVFLGKNQIQWLKKALKESQSTWKIIASDMPIGLIVSDGDNAENLANGDGPALGRELEIADLLRYIRDENIQNVVWVTADVHYTAAHYYDPANAQFSEFAPFWEFVTGPLNAGTFGPGQLDNTFGPEAVFFKAPPEGQANLPPSAGLQFFGQVDLDAESAALTVSLKDIAGETLYQKTLEPS